jgi:D-beta-D-heptose 7-phosphate kinase/D-beta-D-heptose 1-phosphate adenosyltransferase
MSEAAALAPFIAGFARAKILCVGDAMLDRFVNGTVERVSPEAPIPVVRITEAPTAMPGGAANVAANVAALGAHATLLCVVGDDDEGAELTDLLGRRGIACTPFIDPGRPTTVKTRFAAAGQQLLRTDREDTAPLPPGLAGSLLEALADAVQATDAVVVSDYGKGVLTGEILDALIAHAAAFGKPLIVDPTGRDYARYRGAPVVSPNRAELELACGHACHDDDDVARGAREVMARNGIGAMLVTRSQRGMSIVTAERADHLAVRAREVFDVSGAGDTVVATFALAGAAGAPAIDAARLANAAAGVVVGKAGTAVVSAADLASALHGAASEDKIRSLGAALEAVALWRRQGARIGFTNGCFDLIHPGHVSLIRQARAKCNRLIVGLNSDTSTRALKGEGRPVQSEWARAVVLASLEAVDLVVIFADETPLALIEAIRPEVLVKGADYAIEEIVGAGVVQGYGGEVVRAELLEGESTSGTIARMAAGTA